MGGFFFNVAPCVKHIKVSLQPGQDQCRLCKNPPSDFSSDATSAMLSGAGPPIGHWPHPCNWFFNYFLDAPSITSLQAGTNCGASSQQVRPRIISS